MSAAPATAGSPSERAPLTGLFLAVLVALPWLLYREYLSADTILYQADAAQLHYTRYVVLCEALQGEHALPLWQRFVYGGAPFLANPENPTLYPPALLLASFCPPILTINLIVLTHLSIALAGMFLFVRRLARRLGAAVPHAAAGALAGAAIFALNGYTRMTHLNLVTYGAALALVPWILLAAEGLLHGRSPRRAAALTALGLALQLASGGLWVIAYTALAVCLWFVVEGLLGGRATLARTMTWGLVAALLAGLIAQAQIIPFREWVATTNRGAGLSLAQARGVTLGGHGQFSWELALGAAYNNSGRALPFAIALLALGWWRRRVVWLCFGLALLGFAAALGGPVHDFLVAWVPPFDRVRDARRAWVLTGVFVPVLAGLGTAWLAGRVLAGERARRAAPAAGFALALALLPLLEHTWRHKVHEPASFRAVLGHYENWHGLAAVVGEEWRVAYVGDTAALEPGRNEQVVTTALGLETVSGYLGHAWPLALDRHIYAGFGSPDSTRRRRRLGILSVRGLVLGHAALEDGVLPLAMPRIAQNALFSIEGARVQKNEWARPRVFEPAVTIGVLDGTERALTYAILDDPAFDPRRASAIAVDASWSPAELAALDLLVLPADAPGAPGDAGAAELERSLAAVSSDVAVARVALPLGEADAARLSAALAAAAADASAAGREPASGRLERPTHRARRATRSGDARSGFVVLSEAWALYPGWRVRTDERDLALRSADGVACAVFLEPGETVVEAVYAPRSIRRGFLIGALGLVLTLIVLLTPARRRAAAAPG